MQSLSGKKLYSSVDHIGMFDLTCASPQEIAGSNLKNLTLTYLTNQRRTEIVASRIKKETSKSNTEQEIYNRSVGFFEKEFRSLKENCDMQLVSTVQSTSRNIIGNADQLIVANTWKHSDEEMPGNKNCDPSLTVSDDSFTYLLVVASSVAVMFPLPIGVII